MSDLIALTSAFQSDEDFETYCADLRKWGCDEKYPRRERAASQWEIRTREAQIAAINRLAAALEKGN